MASNLDMFLAPTAHGSFICITILDAYCHLLRMISKEKDLYEEYGRKQ